MQMIAERAIVGSIISTDGEELMSAVKPNSLLLCDGNDIILD